MAAQSPKRNVRSDEQRPRRVVVECAEKPSQRPPQRDIRAGGHQPVHLLLEEPRPGEPVWPREKSLRAFDFDANPNIDAAIVHTLASCEWIKKNQLLCLPLREAAGAALVQDGVQRSVSERMPGESLPTGRPSCSSAKESTSGVLTELGDVHTFRRTPGRCCPCPLPSMTSSAADVTYR